MNFTLELKNMLFDRFPPLISIDHSTLHYGHFMSGQDFAGGRGEEGGGGRRGGGGEFYLGLGY